MRRIVSFPAIRAEYIGFVFQTFNLVSTLNIYENVELPFLYSSMARSQSAKRITEAIDQVGLGKRITHKPASFPGVKCSGSRLPGRFLLNQIDFSR